MRESKINQSQIEERIVVTESGSNSDSVRDYIGFCCTFDLKIYRKGENAYLFETMTYLKGKLEEETEMLRKSEFWLLLNKSCRNITLL